MPKQQAKQISAERLARIAEFVREFKCPECKAYALYVKTVRGVETVLCRKCGYNTPLADFARDFMGFQEIDGTASVEVPDFLGNKKRREV